MLRVLINKKHPPMVDAFLCFKRMFYQILTRFSGAKYMASPSLLSNASMFLTAISLSKYKMNTIRLQSTHPK